MVAEIKWIADGPGSQPSSSTAKAPAIAGVRPRRTHAKSRSGCRTCKSRRKKCDEVQPACGQCQSKGLRCDYMEAHRDIAQSSVSRSQSQFSMSRQNARKELAGILELVQGGDTPIRSHPDNVDILRIVDHFMNEKNPWIGTPATQRVLQRHGVRLGVEAPHMLHAIISFSAAHMDHLQPSPRMRVAALHHFGRVTVLYADAVQQLKPGTVNDLFGTCIMITMLSYLVVGYDNPKLLCNPEEHECNWDAFRSLGGVRLMQGVPELRKQLHQGVWVPLMQEAGERNAEMDEGPHVAPTWWLKIRDGLCKLCNVSPDLTHGDSVYLEPLRGLDRLAHRSLDDAKIGQLMHYIGNLPKAFSKVLEQLDTRAMLLILYWHTFLLLIGQWWATHTGVVACRRTIAYLWKVGSGEVRKLLTFPAALCDLDLQALDRFQKGYHNDPTDVSLILEAERLHNSGG